MAQFMLANPERYRAPQAQAAARGLRILRVSAVRSDLSAAIALVREAGEAGEASEETSWIDSAKALPRTVASWIWTHDASFGGRPLEAQILSPERQ